MKIINDYHYIDELAVNMGLYSLRPKQIRLYTSGCPADVLPAPTESRQERAARVIAFLESIKNDFRIGQYEKDRHDVGYTVNNCHLWFWCNTIFPESGNYTRDYSYITLSFQTLPIQTALYSDFIKRLADYPDDKIAAYMQYEMVENPGAIDTFIENLYSKNKGKYLYNRYGELFKLLKEESGEYSMRFKNCKTRYYARANVQILAHAKTA